MQPGGPALLDTAVEDAGRWVDEVVKNLGDAHPHRAYSALRAVLHTVRDSLSFEEAVRFGGQLPILIHGLYLEGWPRRNGRDPAPGPVGFLARVAERLADVPELSPDRAARAVFQLLARQVAEGGLFDIRMLREQPLAEFWPHAPERTAAPFPEIRPTESERRARIERTRQEIRDSIERARRDGVEEADLPVISEPERKASREPTPPKGRGRDVFDKPLQKANVWLKELAEILDTTDRRGPFLALRAVLQTLCARLRPDEALQLGAQLPLILRGLAFEGWSPENWVAFGRHKEEFLEPIARKLETFRAITPEAAARAVFLLLSFHLTEGELAGVRGHLPRSIRSLWPDPRARGLEAGGRPALARAAGPARRRSRARRARKEIRSALARARAVGISEGDLPMLVSPRRGRPKPTRHRPPGEGSRE